MSYLLNFCVLVLFVLLLPLFLLFLYCIAFILLSLLQTLLVDHQDDVTPIT